jgi:hypothetical protein
MAELAAAVAKNEETARIMAETARQLASMSESTQVILAKITEIGRRLEAVEEATAAKAARDARDARVGRAVPGGNARHVIPPVPIPRRRVPPLILTAEQEAERNAMLEAAFSGAHGIKFGGARRTRRPKKQRRNRKTKHRC